MLNGDKPLYSQIIEILRERIRSGEYIPDQQLPTEVELAEQFGVSRITSKRALIELEREGLIYRRRGSGSYVKKKEEERRRPTNEATPASNRIISLILPYVASNSMLGYIPGVTSYLDAKGYYLSIHTSDWSSAKEYDMLKSLPKRGISGIILYPVSSQRNLDIVNALHINGFPIVTIDQYYATIPLNSVVSDNFSGGYSAASKLIELGHTRIAFLSTISIEYRSTVRDRFFGYCQALKDNGIPVDIELIFTDFPEESERDTTKRPFYKALIQKMLDAGVTAIQAEHDMVAFDLIKAALDLGIKVPQELSIIGFDNNPEIAQMTDIPITTVEQNSFEIGRKSAELIVGMIETGNRQRSKQDVPVKLIVKDSAAAIQDAASLNI